MGRAEPPVLVVSFRWPPAKTGTPIILYELFKHFPKDACHVICGPGLRPRGEKQLPFSTRRLTVEALDGPLSVLYRKSRPQLLPLLTRYLIRKVKQLKPQAIYGHFPDAVFATAAARAAEATQTPLVVYFDILWDGFHAEGVSADYEGYVARVASRRFAITEDYCEHLSRKHGVPFELLPHALDVPGEFREPDGDEQEDVVHFSGAVYPEMNLDSVQRLYRVLQKAPDAPRLEICGFTPKRQLESWGLSDVDVRSLPRDQLLAHQQSRRVMYLPEAFESSTPEMIQYNFPTKALEYMHAGVPILVHAPADCYLSKSAREHGWGLLVDTPDETSLLDALTELRCNETVRSELVNKGFIFAKQRDAREWSRRLQEALGVQFNAA